MVDTSKAFNQYDKIQTEKNTSYFWEKAGSRLMGSGTVKNFRVILQTFRTFP